MKTLRKALSAEESQRYNRQMLLDGWGERTQQALKSATVFVAGAGGLGSPACLYLAAAGVGRLVVCDRDVLDLSNLNRQIVHNTGRIGMPKASSAERTLEALNPEVTVTPITDPITAENVLERIRGADVILDCLDNFPTRYLLNQAAIALGIPLVYASVWGLEGRLSVLRPPQTPCLMCLHPEAPPTGVFPVLGTTPGVIGTLQALEAIKCLTGIGRPLLGRLLVWDGGAASFRTYPLRRDPACPACGPAKT